ncbi:hypothetical protein T4D_3079 [Trichinella pseudospiralis]|uniref:Uncharacterized protein n=1 Tax=Trichinella pseudospiralis TaxID=6337 RepID=A0A0V1F0C0_TRIPS|nr:hypothetical protein T4D_3079 [Trichinella pseudospiralis]
MTALLSLKFHYNQLSGEYSERRVIFQERRISLYILKILKIACNYTTVSLITNCTAFPGEYSERRVISKERRLILNQRRLKVQ